MKKLFFFISISLLYFVTSSTLLSQYYGYEISIYDDLGLIRRFRKFLHKPTDKRYCRFRSYARKYYEQSPIDCLKFLGRCRNDRVCKVLFWRALVGPNRPINPIKISPIYYFKVLNWISNEIGGIFQSRCCYDESKFKNKLEATSQLIKSAEKTLSELKSLGINQKLVNEFGDLVVIWKFLIKNISFDFNTRTINYNSLFWTLNEIISFVKADSSSNNLDLYQSKLYSLLWFYLNQIYKGNSPNFFEVTHSNKILVIYLIMEIWLEFDFKRGEKHHSNILRINFKKLYINGSLNLEPFVRLLKMCDPSRYSKLLKVPKKVTNYYELTHYLEYGYFKGVGVHKTWEIRALAELELYISRNKGKYNLPF